MGASRAGELTPAALDAEAQVEPSHGFLDDRAGATFRHTLDRAPQAQSSIIPVATWDDHGEGTVVEPTREHGTRDLRAIPEARRRDAGPSPFSADDLQLPSEISTLRTTSIDPPPPPPARRGHPDAAGRSLDAGDPKAARAEDDRARPSPPLRR